MGSKFGPFPKERRRKEKPRTMVVTPLHSRDDDELRQLKLLFRDLGCDIYKDPSGQCFAVATSREMMPESLSVVFEIEHLRQGWRLDDELQ